MGDPRRFHAFAEVIVKHLHPSMAIADVAGGKGYLQAALRERGFRSMGPASPYPNDASGASLRLVCVRPPITPSCMPGTIAFLR
ncbi:MAG: hypothetical protein OJF50_006645 [Nitrospira sp.]|jgi:metallophosphoesterase superfamily enzyme|nr:hypothetical protein [Nitrospira sp.]